MQDAMEIAQPHIQELIETTIQFLQFMTSIFLIILSATGIAFYYHWTTKSRKMEIVELLPFALPAGIVLLTFLFIGYLYRLLIKSLAAGSIEPYIEFWFSYVGYVLWLALFVSIVCLVIALIMVNRKIK